MTPELKEKIRIGFAPPSNSLHGINALLNYIESLESRIDRLEKEHYQAIPKDPILSSVELSRYIQKHT